MASPLAQVKLSLHNDLGAFGEVRKCQHKKLKAIRAVKILRKNALDEKEIERFIHEIEILKKLVCQLLYNFITFNL